MKIAGLLHHSLNEWEGHITNIVFTPGCNWRCAYCHAQSLVEGPIDVHLDTKSFIAELAADRWCDGVAITGGEPTLQSGLYDFISEIKALKPVKLETNGTNPSLVRKLLENNLLSCLSMDYKNPLDNRLSLLVRSLNLEATPYPELVSESFDLMRASKVEKELHTTLCPAYITADLIEEMGRSIEDPSVLWVLQRYEYKNGVLDLNEAGEHTFNTGELEQIEKIAKGVHPRVLLRR